MAQSSDPTGTVTSADRTRLAFWVTGSGPTLVLVHGTTSDHTTYDELVPHLASRRTVVTYDRRGRGVSGDGQSYDMERELEDAAAVFAAAAQRQGGPVDVFGHSFGAFVALGAATLSDHVRAIVAYSPGFGAEYPEGALERIESATASDDLDAALQVMFAEVIGMPADEIEFMRQSPVWPVRVAAAGTVARECRADEAFLRGYAARLAEVRPPVLVVDGAANNPAKRRIAEDLGAALPGARMYEMAGQGHVAHHVAAPALADLSLDFFEDPGPVPAAAVGSKQS
jgi:pimeloyl-ACP methyl ester carboxylesterase